MGQLFHTPLTDGLTALNSAGIDAPMTELDSAIGNMGKHAFAIAQGPITVGRADSGLTQSIRWPTIDIYHHRNDALGTIVRNYVAAGAVTIAAGNLSTLCRYVTLSDTNDQVLSMSAADYDGLPASLGKDAFILFMRARSPLASQYSTWWFPGILRMQPIVASWSIGAGVTSTAVAFPAGVVTRDLLYMVILSATSPNFLSLDPYVAPASRFDYGFTVTHLPSGVGGQTFDYTIIT